MIGVKSKLFGFRSIAIIILGCFFLPLLGAGLEDSRELARSEHFTLQGLEPDGRLAKSVLEMAEESYEYLHSRLPPSFPGHFQLIWRQSSGEFGESIGDRNPNIMAVAVLGRPLIMFNGPRINQSSVGEFKNTFIHELTHVYISYRARSEIPLWLNEGIATNVADQAEWRATFGMTLRNWLGWLPSLGDLEKEFPSSPYHRTEAYRCSYLAVRHLRGKMGLLTLLQKLDDPEFTQSFYRQEVWNTIDEGYRRRYLRAVNVFYLFTSNSLFWIGIVVLFIAAYFIKRRRSKRKLEEMEEDPFNFDAE